MGWKPCAGPAALLVVSGEEAEMGAPWLGDCCPAEVVVVASRPWAAVGLEGTTVCGPCLYSSNRKVPSSAMAWPLKWVMTSPGRSACVVGMGQGVEGREG